MPPIKSTAPVEHLRSELPQLTRVGSSDPINDISSIVVVHLLLERTVQVTVVRHNSDVDNQDHTIDLGHQIRFPPANSSRYYWFQSFVFLCLSQNLFFFIMGPCTLAALLNGSPH